jgi:hypothetical protein
MITAHEVAACLLEAPIQEILSKLDAYPFRQVDAGEDYVSYNFKSDKTDTIYKVSFSRHNNTWERGYCRNEIPKPAAEPFKIIATVTAITLDFIEVYKPILLRIRHGRDTPRRLRTTYNTRPPPEQSRRAKLNREYLMQNIPPGYRFQQVRSTSLIYTDTADQKMLEFERRNAY